MRISLEELRDNLEKFLTMAESQDVFITKDGKDVVKIVSANVGRDLSVKSIMNEITQNLELGNADSGQYSQLIPTLTGVSDLIGIHSGKEKGYADRTRRYLEVMVNALSDDDDYKNEVASWDKGLFLLSANLHDVGEAAVTDSYLKKAGELTKEEYEDIKAHTEHGVKIVHRVKENLELNALFDYAEIVAGSHHEKWDGTGYPLGLKGDKIPLQGRIMAIVDVYNALTTERAHRKKKTHDEAIAIIKDGSGTHFDPGLVKAFTSHENEFKKTVEA